jgi:predicted nucleic acid-binding protein
MILVDTGPLVALFDPKDGDHDRVVAVLKKISQPLMTTIPVLTEAFHLLGPGTRGASALQQFVLDGGVTTWFLSAKSLLRVFNLMERYSDRPMDLADGSLVAAAEAVRMTNILTLDRNDFATYRAQIGRRFKAFRVLDPA